MMKAVITGAAGFIGSHLCDTLLDEGWDVVGVDAFTDYYDVARKRSNLSAALHRPGFELVEGDLVELDLDRYLDADTVVFHQAGQPGVRASWRNGFREYVHHNVLATQQLLEAAARRPVHRFVYASSSSVYGNAPAYPTGELTLPQPHSPYGVTKLAGEQLVRTYTENFGVHGVSLRYFTVYGPRQRPDMATHRLIEAALGGEPFTLYGDGSKIRDFTYVGDVVRANLLAATADVRPGAVLNVAGGSNSTVTQLIELVAAHVGNEPVLDRRPDAPGDVERTGGDITCAETQLGWTPLVDLSDGVAAQVEWHRSLRVSAVMP